MGTGRKSILELLRRLGHHKKTKIPAHIWKEHRKLMRDFHRMSMEVHKAAKAWQHSTHYAVADREETKP